MQYAIVAGTLATINIADDAGCIGCAVVRAFRGSGATVAESGLWGMMMGLAGKLALYRRGWE